MDIKKKKRKKEKKKKKKEKMVLLVNGVVFVLDNSRPTVHGNRLKIGNGLYKYLFTYLVLI
jgi:hypothetical protein